MKAYVFFSVIFLVFIQQLNAQFIIKGKITTASTGQAVPSASVFLSNTSFGTVSNDSGFFQLNVPSQGKYELVVSSIGYATFVQSVNINQSYFTIDIRLSIKANDLGNVTVGALTIETWGKWEGFFKETFIGLTPNSSLCKILNHKVIQFRYSKSEKKLFAFADEDLIIENKSLGYKIKYKLEEFEYNFKENILYFLGYPLFEEIEAKRKNQTKKWLEKRAAVYDGSMMHFMRSVYRNRLLQDGFEIRSLEKYPNVEKQRVKALMFNRSNTATSNDSKVVIKNGIIDIGSLNNDSAIYYNKILAQKDIIEKFGSSILPGDSIAYGLDSFTAALSFPHYLYIIYKNKPEPKSYAAAAGRPNNVQAFCVSELLMRDALPIQIQSNGSYYDPTKLLSSGYWAWSEKIATMLPFNYNPPPK